MSSTLKKPTNTFNSKFMTRFSSRFAGFTLIELLVTVSVLAVLLGLASPSLRDAYRRSEARTATSEFYLGLMYARSEAISKNRCVTMCMGSNLSTDAPTCQSTGNEWNAGWIIFANPLCDDDATNSNAELLKIYIGNPSGPTIQQSSGATVRSLRYDSRGNSSLSAARGWNISPTHGNPLSIVCTNMGGRVYINSNSIPSCSN
jgi:type IV fimbrial biogenesis protein FimT